MKKRINLITLFLGILTGASTMSMIFSKKTFTTIIGSISIVCFLYVLAMNLREGE